MFCCDPRASAHAPPRKPSGDALIVCIFSYCVKFSNCGALLATYASSGRSLIVAAYLAQWSCPMKSSGRSNQVADHCLPLDFEVGFLSPDSSGKALFRPRSDTTLSNVAGLFLNAVSARFRQSSHSQQAATHSVHFGQYSNFGTRLEHLAHATSLPAVASITRCARGARAGRSG